MDEPDRDAITNWHLEGPLDPRGRPWRVPLCCLPLTVGRHPGSHLQLDSLKVSHRHAEIFEQDHQVWIRDVGSTNGTFLNQVLLKEEAAARVGDIIRFGDTEFQVAEMRPYGQFIATRSLRPEEIEAIWGQRGRLLEVLEKKAIRSVFQPIYQLSNDTIIGYEGLARSALTGFEVPPLELFHLAETMSLGAELSRLCRDRIAVHAPLMAEGEILFVNTHPEELEDPEALLESIRQLRAEVGEVPLVLELHEEAMVDPEPLRQLNESLREQDVGLAFDDFGSGKARLLELVEVRPAYLKVDMRLIRNLHEASAGRQEMIRTIVELCQSMNITTVAEGIENQEEADACLKLGFELGQGFHLGMPGSLPGSSSDPVTDS